MEWPRPRLCSPTGAAILPALLAPPATDDDRFDDVVPRIDRMDLAAGEAELRRVLAVREIMRLHGLICDRWGYGHGARQLSQLLDISS